MTSGNCTSGGIVSTQTLSEFLICLANELEQLQEMALQVDGHIGEVAMQPSGGIFRADLQKIDYLSQALGDLGTVLRGMPECLDADFGIDAAKATDQVKMRDLKARLSSNQDSALSSPEHGAVTLF